MRSSKLWLAVVSIAIPLGFLLYPAFPAMYMAVTGCATGAQYEAPPAEAIPDFNRDLFTFPKFELPNPRKPGSAGMTVISIIPEYKDTKNRDTVDAGQVSASGAASGTMTREMVKVFRTFAGSAGEDIEALLVAKGMTAKGPFVLEEVTFPDKKGADLTVLMQLIFDFQYTDEKYVRSTQFEGNITGKVYKGNMSIGLKVYYYLLEPLSEEKMWVKKLDLGSQEFEYEYAKGQEQYVAGTRFVSDGCGGGYTHTDYAWRDTTKILYDSRAKVFSDLLKDSYPKLMTTASKYFDVEEMVGLREKAKDIRDRWGSSSYRRGAPN